MAHTTQPTPDAGRTEHDADSHRVLHVDDDSLQTELVSRQLPNCDDRLTVDTANSVDEAVERLDSETYDVLVTDFDMGPADATDLLDEINERENVPTVLFTSHDTAALAPSNVLDRVDEYLRKDTTGECYGVLADLVGTVIDRTERPQGGRVAYAD